MKKTSFVFMLLLLLLMPFGVMAQNLNIQDSAGNYIHAEYSVENITGDIPRDAYVFSTNTFARNANIGGSLLNLSYSVNIADSTIGGSIRSLSESLTISNTAVDNNLTIASRSIEILGNSSSNAVYCVADNLNFEGTTNTINMSGETATISGTVTGDVNLDVSNVIIKSTADIQGNLNLTSENEPIVEDGARIGNTNFNQVVPEAAHVETPIEVLTRTIVDIFYWTVVTAILAFLIVIFAGNSVNQAVNRVKYHPVAVIVTGLVSMIVIPVLSIVLILPYVTLPITLMLSTAYGLIASICVPFAAAVVGRWVLPKLNKWITTLIFALIFGIISRIPYLGIILDILCMILMLGYIVLKLYENMLSAFKHETPAKIDIDNRNELSEEGTAVRREATKPIDIENRRKLPEDRE